MEKIELGKFRSMFFPIYANEIKKLLPLTFIFLFISFNYAMLRGLKDVYIYNVMTKESIYLVKVLVIPSIIFFTILYNFLAKHVSKNVRFNVVISYFLVFFCLFAFFLLPNYKSLQLDGFANWLNNIIKFPALCNCIRYWPISLLYIHAEAWGTIVLGVSFWTFANDIISSFQAKRVYPFLTIGAAVGAISSGFFMLSFSKNGNLLLKIFLCLTLGILIIYNILTFFISKDPKGFEIEEKNKKIKVKKGFVDSILFLLKSKYLLLLTCVVFGYNMFIVFLESVWKGRVGSFENSLVNSYLIENPGMFEAAKGFAKKCTTEIYGLQSVIVGIFSLLWIFFVAASVSKKKWKNVALFTPIVSLCASCFFFFIIFFREKISFLASFFGITDLLLLVLFGSFIVCFIKSSKYVFFDTSKERAYIPLDEDSKVNGKAAIDAIGSRLAKGSSSILISSLIYIFGSLDNIIYISFFFVFVLLLMWIIAVKKLSPLYEQKLAENQKQKQ